MYVNIILVVIFMCRIVLTPSRRKTKVIATTKEIVMKIAQLIQAIYAALPYSNQIKKLEIFEKGVLIEWRGDMYTLSHYDGVGVTCGEYENGCSVGSSAAILMRESIQREFNKLESE